MILRVLERIDDWSRDVHIEISIDNSEKVLSVLTKITESQISLEKGYMTLTENILSSNEAPPAKTQVMI